MEGNEILGREKGQIMACSMIYLLPSILIACSAYHLILTIVAFLSYEDKNSSSEDMGIRLPISEANFVQL